MRALYSTKYSAGAVNTALFILRLGLGILIVKHGYDKISNFSSLQYKFMDFLHLGSKISLVLVIFAEFFCGILIILGLFTRFACVPLIIAMCVALFVTNDADFFGKGQASALYLTGFIALLFAGAGRISVDRMIGK
ncbi:MAG: DoxX family protein [Ginsengibacter sp.]